MIVQDVIDAGYPKSAAARVESIASPGELVTRVGQCLQELFAILAREHPQMIGTSALMSFNGSGWPRPVDCIRAIGVYAAVGTAATPTIPVGTEISVVAFNDQLFSAGNPSVYELGQQFNPVGQSMDPSGGTLTLVYARAAQIPAQTTDPIDPLYPQFYPDFLNYDMAAYLATKDARTADSQTFLSMKSAALAQIIQWAEGQTYSLRQRFLPVQPITTNINGGKQSPAES
jgi:hypothetical protein